MPHGPSNTLKLRETVHGSVLYVQEGTALRITGGQYTLCPRADSFGFRVYLNPKYNLPF